VDYRRGTARPDALRCDINGTDGDLLVASPSPNGSIQATTLELGGSRGVDTSLGVLPVPLDMISDTTRSLGVPAGNVARLYEQFARDLELQAHDVPDFTVALERHLLVQSIQDIARSS
jgi:predicted dehydrogenase